MAKSRKNNNLKSKIRTLKGGQQNNKKSRKKVGKNNLVKTLHDIFPYTWAVANNIGRAPVKMEDRLSEVYYELEKEKTKNKTEKRVSVKVTPQSKNKKPGLMNALGQGYSKGLGQATQFRSHMTQAGTMMGRALSGATGQKVTIGTSVGDLRGQMSELFPASQQKSTSTISGKSSSGSKKNNSGSQPPGPPNNESGKSNNPDGDTLQATNENVSEEDTAIPDAPEENVNTSTSIKCPCCQQDSDTEINIKGITKVLEEKLDGEKKNSIDNLVKKYQQGIKDKKQKNNEEKGAEINKELKELGKNELNKEGRDEIEAKIKEIEQLFKGLEGEQQLINDFSKKIQSMRNQTLETKKTKKKELQAEKEELGRQNVDETQDDQCKDQLLQTLDSLSFEEGDGPTFEDLQNRFKKLQKNQKKTKKTKKGK